MSAAALLLMAALFVPGPSDPVCVPGQSVEVDHCAQGQLPGETVGRELDPATPAPSDLPAAELDAGSPIPEPGIGEPAPVRADELAHTGVPGLPYALTAAALIALGVSLRRRAENVATFPPRPDL